jgi:hypothetical protein
MLGLLILAGFFVAERSSEIRQAIDSILDTRSRPAVSNRAAAPTAAPDYTRNKSALPTPKVEGRGEVFHTKTRAAARACANVSCEALAVLSPGTTIVAQRYAEGQYVYGSDRWIVFRLRGQDANIHSSVVSRVRRISEPSPEQSPTAEPTQISATNDGQGEVFYVAAKSNARSCARLWCDVVEVLERGTRITALRYLKGQTINGNDRWIRFSHNREHLSIHSSKLTRTDPNADATAAPLAENADQTGSTDSETYYLTTRARARACTRLDCDFTEYFAKGTEIVAAGSLHGERINSNSRWIVFRHQGRELYFHSDLLTKERLDVIATPQPTTTTRRNTAKPTAEGENEIFFVNGEAHARTCARMTCSEAQLLWPGMRITALRYAKGQVIEGSDRWIRFINRGWIQYVHSSFLSRDEPTEDATAQTSPTPQSKRDGQTARAGGQEYLVQFQTRTHSCASLGCDARELAEGSRIEANRIVYGQTIGASDEWIEFFDESGYRYVHAGDVVLVDAAAGIDPTSTATEMLTATEAPASATDPPPSATSTVAATATERPPPTVTVPPAPNYVVETERNVNANIRACPSTDCDIVAKLSPGTEVEVMDSVKGENVYETDIWLEIRLDGASAFIHSELVAGAG